MDKPQLPKMLKKLHLLVFLVCSLIGLSGYAQTFPVIISTQIPQPSPIYLSNYADATTINSPIKIQLVLNDLTISNRQVRLKCYFQGNSISFSTNDFVVGARPLYLEGGFPLQLINVDLAPYFEFQNILGLNPNQYAQPLPEGIYNFSVEVYDFATNKKLSKKTAVTTIIFQNEPPFLNLPLNNASIMQQNIQNIVFSWTPRSINVSNVEYEFSLVEIWDNYTPVQNAFAYSPPLYTTTTRNTTLQYGITQPQLIPGKKYAWRIKAKAILGAEEIGVFKNNGYSEIFSFTYEVFCTAPLSIATSGVSQDQAKITWSGSIDNYDYQVNYREKNSGSEWYKLVTPRESATISNLKPNATYEYTVGSSCDVGKYTHSTIHEFTTLEKDEIAFAGCGIKPDPKDLANKTPLPQLFPNDVVTAGDFPIVVLKATGSNGNFTGEGYVTLPFLEKFRKLIDAADVLGGDKINLGQFSRIRITFNNIGVNTDFKLISGEIVASYDPNWGGMADLDGVVNDAFGDAGNVVNHQYDLSIKSVVKNPDGTITVTSTTGVTSALDKTVNDIVITDKDGKQFAVPANAPAGDIKQTGQLAPGGIPTSKNTNGMGSGGDVAEISSADVNVIFSKGDGKYSFDTAPTAENGSLTKTYQTIPKKGGGTYKVNYKAISDKPNTDVVVATVDFKNGKTKKDLVFKTQNGTAIDSTQIVWKDNVATLTLKKTLDFAKETIIATVKPVTPKDPKEAAGKYDIAGTMDLWHLTNKKVNVTLVSVNKAKIPSDAQSQLNAIYEPAGVTFNVNTVDVTLDNTWGESIETSESGLLATYTPEQQQITANLKLKLGADYKKDTYYVIYTDAPSSKSNILGFMPLKRQYGFIFNKTNIVRTLAHELGHGVFGLEHPFTQYNTSTTTDLLMDYGTGVELSHNDWQVLHAPGLQLYPFIQGDSDGEHAGGGLGITPSNKVIVAYPSTYDNMEATDVVSFMVSAFKNSNDYAVTGYAIYDSTKNLKARYKWEADDKNPNGGSYKSNGETFNVTLKDEGPAYIYKLLENCFVWYKRIEWKKGNTLSNYQTTDSEFARDKTFNFDSACLNKLNTNIKDTYANCDLTKEDEGFKKITTIVADTKNLIEKNLVITTINGVCLSSLRRLKDSEKQQLFERITTGSLDNETEIATLKLMSSMYSTQYPDFIKILQANNNEKLSHLIEEIDDKLFFMYGDNNYTDFTSAIAEMVKSLSDDIKWKYINLLINKRYSKLNDRERDAITAVLSNLTQDKLENPDEASFLIEMLKFSPDLINLLDYKNVYLIAKARSKNKTVFDQFTQTIKRVEKTTQEFPDVTFTTLEVNGDPDWFSPRSMSRNKQVNGQLTESSIFSQKDLVGVFGWVDYLYSKDGQNILKLLNSKKPEELKAVLVKFNEQLLAYINKKTEDDKNYWDAIKNVTCANITDILDRIRLNESSASLQNVKHATRVSIIENIILCQAKETINVENTEDALFKVLRSFEATDTKILTELERMGFNTIYTNFSGSRLNKFCFWVASQITSSGHISTSQSVKLFTKNNELITDSNKLIQLEEDMLQFKNTSFDKKSKTTFNVTGFGELNYNEMVPVYIAGSFEYLDEEFKEGTVAYMPLIQFIAMSNNNTNEVLKKSGWVALDGIFLVIGVGELKYVYTVGNDIHKAIALLEIAGNATSATAQLLNNDYISEDFRFALQMAGLAMNIPSLIGNMPRAEIQAEKLLTKLEKEANSVNKVSYSNYIRNLFKFKQPITLLERLEKFSILNNKVKLLGNLEGRFMEDFANVSDDVLKGMNKADSEFFSGWQNFRKNYPTKTICNF